MKNNAHVHPVFSEILNTFAGERSKSMITMQQHTQRMALLNNHEYERFIGELHALLLEERTDDALDLVRAEYLAIHGPGDGNAG